jgi:ferredoxin
MLRAFDMGAQGLVIISGEEKCQMGFEHAQWESNAEFVKGLLNCWQIKPERVKSIQFSSDDLVELENSLSCFAADISGSTPILLKSSDPTLISDDGLRLSELIKGMVGKAWASSSNGITGGAVPFGKLKLDSSQCTGCGLCAVNCPTNALTIGSGSKQNNFELFFQQNLCIGCSKCVDVCPEKCLQLQRILELDRIDDGAYRLFSDDIFTCRNCGEQVAPNSMIIHLKEKLQNSDNILIEQIELCNKCKNEIHNYRLGIRVDGQQVEIGTKHSCHGIDSQGEE